MASACGTLASHAGPPSEQPGSNQSDQSRRLPPRFFVALLQKIRDNCASMPDAAPARWSAPSPNRHCTVKQLCSARFFWTSRGTSRARCNARATLSPRATFAIRTQIFLCAQPLNIKAPTGTRKCPCCNGFRQRYRKKISGVRAASPCEFHDEIPDDASTPWKPR